MKIQKHFISLFLICLLFSSCQPSEEELAEKETEISGATQVAALTQIADMTQIAEIIYSTQTAQAPQVTPTAQYQPGDTRISQEDGMVMVYIPAGNVTIGSDEGRIDWALNECNRLNPEKARRACTMADLEHEAPVHTIFQEGYWIDQTEVTNEMFSKFIEETNYQTDAELWQFAFILDDKDWIPTKTAYWKIPHGEEYIYTAPDGYPVVNVSWNDAWNYCQWAGRRLPTEVEWEKAAGGSDGFMFPWGDDPSFQGKANMADTWIMYDVDISNPDVNDGHLYASPVGLFPDGASPHGVLDMAGNVREWVYDGFVPYYLTAEFSDNHFIASDQNQGITRGGSFASLPIDLRTASRVSSDPKHGYIDLGFRCVDSELSLPEPELKRDFLPDLILLEPFDQRIPDPEGEILSIKNFPKGEISSRQLQPLQGLNVIGKFGNCQDLKIENQAYPDSWINIDSYSNRDKHVLYKDCASIEEIIIRPPSGMMYPHQFIYSKEDLPDSRLQVANFSHYDVYVSLVNFEIGKTYGLYVRDGQTEILGPIKEGTYDLYYTTGYSWSFVEGHFLDPKGYQKLVDPLNFTQYTAWEFSIEVLEDGNASADQINPSEFPSLPE